MGSQHWGLRLFLWLFSIPIGLVGAVGVLLSRPWLLGFFTCAATVELLLDGIVSMIFTGSEQARRGGLVVALLTVPEVITIFCHFAAIIICLVLTLQTQVPPPKSAEVFDNL